MLLQSALRTARPACGAVQKGTGGPPAVAQGSRMTVSMLRAIYRRRRAGLTPAVQKVVEAGTVPAAQRTHAVFSRLMEPVPRQGGGRCTAVSGGVSKEQTTAATRCWNAARPGCAGRSAALRQKDVCTRKGRVAGGGEEAPLVPHGAPGGRPNGGATRTKITEHHKVRMTRANVRCRTGATRRKRRRPEPYVRQQTLINERSGPPLTLRPRNKGCRGKGHKQIWQHIPAATSLRSDVLVGIADGFARSLALPDLAALGMPIPLRSGKLSRCARRPVPTVERPAGRTHEV